MPRLDAQAQLPDVEYRYGALSLDQEANLIRQELRRRSNAAIPTYCVPICFATDAPVDEPAIRGAWAALLRRHSLLRTTFSPTGRYCEEDRVRQLVAFQRTGAFVPGLFKSEVWDVPRLTLRHTRTDAHSEHDAIAQIAALATDWAATPATGQAPVLHVISTRSGLHYVVGILSHALADAWSFKLLQSEYARYYGLLVRKQRCDVQDATGFDQFAAAETVWALGSGALPHLRHWRTQWEIAEGHYVRYTTLPFAMATRGRAAAEIETLHITLDGEASHVVRRYLATSSYSAHAVFRTAFMLALSAATGVTDVACWANFANRRGPKSRGIVGPVATRYPLGFTIRAQSFHDACGYTNTQLVASRLFEALPTTAFLLRSGRRLPDTSTIITFDSGWITPEVKDHHPVQLRPVRLKAGRHWVDLDVRVRQEPRSFTITATFNGSKYLETGIRQLLHVVRHIVLTGCAAPMINVHRCLELAERRWSQNPSALEPVSIAPAYRTWVSGPRTERGHE